MRIDKFLKVSRIIKRRALAKEVADQGRIKINDTVAKASSEVKIGDLVEIQFGNKIITVRVADLVDSTKKEDAKLMFEVVKEEKIES